MRYRKFSGALRCFCCSTSFLMVASNFMFNNFTKYTLSSCFRILFHLSWVIHSTYFILFSSNQLVAHYYERKKRQKTFYAFSIIFFQDRRKRRIFIEDLSSEFCPQSRLNCEKKIAKRQTLTSFLYLKYWRQDSKQFSPILKTLLSFFMCTTPKSRFCE